MPRLPQPGGDDGKWGDILNEYLSVEHNADGTQKPLPQSKVTNLSSDLAAKYVRPGGGIPETDLDTPTQTKLNAGGPDATTSSKGVVQLAGDLGGSAASPTVPGLAAKANDSAVVHNNGDEAVAGVKTFSSAPIVPDGSFAQSKVTNLTSDLAAKQGSDASLTALAGLDSTPGLIAQTGADTFSKRTIGAGSLRVSVSNGSGAAGDPVIDVNTGTTASTVASGNDSRITGAIQSSTVTAKGDLLAAVSSNSVTNLPVGSNNQVLTADSAATTGVKWANAVSAADATTVSKGIVQLAGDLGGTAAAPTVPGLTAKANDSAVVHNTGNETIAGNKTFSGQITFGIAVTTVSINHSATASDWVILANANAAPLTITLPTAVGASGKQYVIKKIDASVNAVTIATTASQTIDGDTTQIITVRYASVTIVSDGANWFLI